MTVIIDPVILFREGLRRILDEAGFQTIWCSDKPPSNSLPIPPGSIPPLLIIGSEVQQALIQAADLKRVYPDARLVLLLDKPLQEHLIPALRIGVHTIIFRFSSCEAFIGTLKLVLDGATVFPSSVIDRLLDRQDSALVSDHNTIGANSGFDGRSAHVTQQSSALSTRELGVLQWLRDGLANKEIARLMGITEATVKVHVKAILRKARVKNRTQVAMWASRFELGQPTQLAVTCTDIKPLPVNHNRMVRATYQLTGLAVEPAGCPDIMCRASSVVT